MSWYDIIFSEGKDLYTMETAVRTAIIFILSFILIRIAKKRFLGRNTAFDIVLGVISGSVASRAINGSAKLFPTAASLVVLIILHWIVSFFVSRNSWFANVAEGKPAKLLENGSINYSMLKRHHFREMDVYEAARLKGNIGNLKNVKEANLETNGEISIIKE
jgi:uncharacterized membrane protein YcaP (DUF421 family)